MRKRPLCFACVLILALQALRMLLFGAEENSALSKALQDRDVNDYLLAEGIVSDIQETEKVITIVLKNNHVYPVDAGFKEKSFHEEKIAVCFKPKQKINHKTNQIQYEVSKVKLGMKVRVRGKAELFERARNPGNFDQKSYYGRQKLYIRLWVTSAELTDIAYSRVGQGLHMLRQKWKASLIKSMGEYYGGTMSAILIGEKQELDPEMKKMYQKNGIGHVLAISGLHMSFIGIGLYNLLRKSGLGFGLSALAGSLLLIGYTMLVGAGVSSKRALLMFLVKMGAEVTGRDYDLPTSLGLSAAIICTEQPLYLLDAGFQLSFGAICGISMLTPIFEEMLGERIGKNPLLKGLAGSLSVNLFLLGPMLYFYYEIPPYSLVLNLVILAILPLVMGTGIFGSMLLTFWWQAGTVVLKLGSGVLWIFDRLCLAAEWLPGARLVTGKPGIWLIAAYYLSLLYVCGRFYSLKEKAVGKESRAGKKLPGIFLICLSVLMVFGVKVDHRLRDEVRVTVLDVGQGDGICIETEKEAYFVDGGSSDVSKAGTYRIEPYLLSRGISKIEYAFLSHGDEDHSNGMEELLADQKRGVRVKNLVLPPYRYHDEKIQKLVNIAQKHNTRVLIMSAGNRISGADKDFSLECLAPDNEDLEAGNEASMVLQLTYQEFEMLLTGDVEARGEELLISSGRLGNCDLLKCAHHGSKNSGSDAFLNKTCPSVAIISAGKDNKYGHPHKETLERLQERGIRVYNTQESGAVTVRSDGNRIRIEGFLK